MSKESTNLNIRSSLRWTNRRIVNTESPRRWRQEKDVSVRTIRLKRKSCIHTHKPLNAQNQYNLHKAVYVLTSRLKRKIRTAYAKQYTYTKDAYIAQSRTHTYAKYVQPTKNRLHYAKLYLYVRKSRTTYARPHTLRKSRTNTYAKDTHRFII